MAGTGSAPATKTCCSRSHVWTRAASPASDTKAGCRTRLSPSTFASPCALSVKISGASGPGTRCRAPETSTSHLCCRSLRASPSVMATEASATVASGLRVASPRSASRAIATVAVLAAAPSCSAQSSRTSCHRPSASRTAGGSTAVRPATCAISASDRARASASSPTARSASPSSPWSGVRTRSSYDTLARATARSRCSRSCTGPFGDSASVGSGRHRQAAVGFSRSCRTMTAAHRSVSRGRSAWFHGVSLRCWRLGFGSNCPATRSGRFSAVTGSPMCTCPAASSPAASCSGIATARPVDSPAALRIRGTPGGLGTVARLTCQDVPLEDRAVRTSIRVSRPPTAASKASGSPHSRASRVRTSPPSRRCTTVRTSSRKRSASSPHEVSQSSTSCPRTSPGVDSGIRKTVQLSSANQAGTDSGSARDTWGSPIRTR